MKIRTHEEGIAQLADTVIAELRAAGDVDPAQFLAAKLKSIDATFEGRGWTPGQRRHAMLGMTARLAVATPMPSESDGDPMERLGADFASLALATPWRDERIDILNGAFKRVRDEIDRHIRVPKDARDHIFGKFAFAIAAHIVEPAGRA